MRVAGKPRTSGENALAKPEGKGARSEGKSLGSLLPRWDLERLVGGTAPGVAEEVSAAA